MKKLSNTAKKLDVVAKIIFWILVIFGAIFVVLALTIALLGENVLSGASHSITLGSATFNIAEQYAPDVRIARLQFGTGAVLVGIAAAVSCLAVHYIRRILDPMKNERPFDGTVHKNIKKLAWLVLIGGAAGSLMSVIGTSIMMMAYDMQSIFSSDAITGLAMDVQIDCTFIVGFVLLYLLSYVFQYGEELQVQSDETL